MDNANYQPVLVREVVQSGVLADDPFVFIDVGCGQGIDPLWRQFEPYLHACGIDPQLSEIERLQGEERNPRVNYHAALVGLPDDDDYHRRRTANRGGNSPYFHPMARSSGALARAREVEAGRRSLSELNTWEMESLTERKVTLSAFVREQGLQNVDFVKIDTDGSDYEVLLSTVESVREVGILGFMVETAYNAQSNDTESSIANIDRVLRGQGFLLYALSVNRYSRAALPAPFVHRALAQTTFGQAMWGDTIYLRDAGSEHYVDIWGDELPPTKLLKLACLYELFRAPDCAVELLHRHERVLEGLLDIRRGLDLLTPRLHGQRVSYADYVAAFDHNPSTFYPYSGRRLVRGVRRLLRAKTGA